MNSLDVSKNPALKLLTCSDNNLNSLDVSKNPVLTHLSCDHNNLRSLDVSKNMGLDWLWCNNNELSSLDISKNTKLTGVNVYYQERDVIASNGEILISALSPSIVSSKITNLQGATLFGNKLVKITGNTITYDYKTGYKNEKMNVTLNVTHKKNGWVNENGGWKYYKDGKAYTGWHKMGKAEGEKTEHWSYFGKDGKLYTGWRNMGKNEGEKTAHWSYFGDNGWLVTNKRFSVAGKTYTADGRGWIK